VPVSRTPVLAALALAVAVAVTGCGSSGSAAGAAATDGVSTSASSGASTPPAPAASTPEQVPAAAVPAVTGALGKEPTIAAPTGAPPSTLEVHDVVAGTGATAAAGDELTVQYRGVFYANGTTFDASWTDNGPFQFLLGEQQVIPGWDEGLVGVKVGGRRELVIPPSLAYGPSDYNGIPGGSTLVFVIDLLGVSAGS
jgi:peptidylprolyl isomerase